MPAKNAIILFVRDEREEAVVKPLPRLFRDLGYGTLNRSIVARLRPALSGADLIIVTTGADSSTPADRYIQQRGSNFGERITNAFTDAFALGYRNVVLIGNDCPTITPGDIGAAFDRLNDGASLVAAPARDGGAFLIAATPDFDADRFERLPWQSPLLFASLIDIAGSVALPILRDDCDRWEEAYALRLLRELFSYRQRRVRFTTRRAPVRSCTLRKALSRHYLTAPPHHI